jgi:hypothetical protein
MAGENTVKLKVNDDIFEVDFDDLELDEIGAIEDLIGKSVQDIDWESARGLQGLAWIAMHRRDPRFTLQQAGKLKFTAFSDPEESEAGKKRPTKAASAASSGGTS